VLAHGLTKPIERRSKVTKNDLLLFDRFLHFRRTFDETCQTRGVSDMVHHAVVDDPRFRMNATGAARASFHFRLEIFDLGSDGCGGFPEHVGHHGVPGWDERARPAQRCICNSISVAACAPWTDPPPSGSLSSAAAVQAIAFWAGRAARELFALPTE
jgi:hypothetical protein